LDRLLAEGLSQRFFDYMTRDSDGHAIRYVGCVNFEPDINKADNCFGLGGFKAYVCRLLFGEVAPVL
jgi:hypothetical protein